MSRNLLNWTVFFRQAIVGYTQATLKKDGLASIAYVLSPEVWGMGVAQRAIEITMADIMREFRVFAFVADTEEANQASRGLLIRTGFAEAHTKSGEVFYRREISIGI